MTASTAAAIRAGPSRWDPSEPSGTRPRHDLFHIRYAGFSHAAGSEPLRKGPGMTSSSNQPNRSPGLVSPRLSAELGAARRHFHRWPLVPSRELKRIRQVLLHCAKAEGTESANQLSEPPQALLDLVTTELQHRGQTVDPIRPPDSPPDSAHTSRRPDKREVATHDRAL